MRPSASQFSASYDTLTKVLSPAVGLVLIAPGFIAGMWWLAILGGAILAVAYAYSVRGYRVEAGSIIVERLVGEVRISVAGCEVRRAHANDLADCIRLWGSGGLFGYYGLFRTAALGKVTWYATRRKDAVLVRSGSANYLFTPDDVDTFLAELPSSSDVAYPMPDDSTLPKWAVGAFVAVPFLGVSIAIALSFYNPGPPQYELDRSGLKIHERLYALNVEPSSIAVEGVRIVNLQAEPGWAPRWKTGGFSNGHYKAGHFRLNNGTSVMLYKADSDTLVLLPARPGKTTVLMQVADPASFVQRIKAEWK